MGQSYASRVQIGKESTPGTAVAATTILRIPFTALQDIRDPEYADEQLGTPLPSSRLVVPTLGARLPLPAAWLTPEQLPYYLNMGIKGVAGVADGSASSGYKYIYSPGTSSVQALYYYTVETGDDQAVEEAEYCFAEQIVLSGEVKKHTMMSANLIGRQVSSSSWTGSLSVPAVTKLLTGNASLWIDDAGGTFGTTSLGPGAVEAFTLTIDTGRKGRFTIDSGQLYFVEAYFDRDAFNAKLEITFEHDTDAINEKAKYQAEAGRLFRMDILGPAYGTAGTGCLLSDSGNNGLRIDFAGTYQDFGALEKSDGRTKVKATLGRGYLAETGEVLEISVCNELSALP